MSKLKIKKSLQTQIQKFVRTLCSGEGPISLVSIDPTGDSGIDSKTFRPVEINAITDWVMRQNLCPDQGGLARNVFYRVNAISPSSSAKAARDGDVTGVRALWVDLDPSKADMPRDTAAKHTEMERRKTQLVERARETCARLKESNIEPSIAALTGNGVQLLWLLGPEATDPATAKELNRRLSSALGGDSAVISPSHLLRLPGTINYPTPQKARSGCTEAQGRLVRCEAKLYENPLELVSKIELKLGKVKSSGIENRSTKCAQISPREKTARTSDRDQALRRSLTLDDIILSLSQTPALDIDSFDHPVIARLNNALTRNANLRRRWVGETDGLTSSSGTYRSELDYAVATCLAWEDFDADEIAFVLRDVFEHGRGEDGRATYFAQTAHKAVTSVREEQSKWKGQHIFPTIDEAVDALNTRFFIVSYANANYVFDVSTGLSQKLAIFHESLAEYRVAGERQSATRIWALDGRRRRYADVVLDPSNPHGPISKNGFEVFNLWRGRLIEHAIDRVGKDAARTHGFKRIEHFLRVVVCKNDTRKYDWLLNWLAHLVQFPEDKPGVALLLKGLEGAGKSIVSDHILRHLVSHRSNVRPSEPAMGYFAAEGTAKELLGSFNDQEFGNFVTLLDEAFYAGDKATARAIKAKFTTEWVTLNRKYEAKLRVQSYTRFVLTGNDVRLVRADMDSRRFTIFDVSSTYKDNKQYFSALRSALTDRHDPEMPGPETMAFFTFLNEFKVDAVLAHSPLLTDELYQERLQTFEDTQLGGFLTALLQQCNTEVDFGLSLPVHSPSNEDQRAWARRIPKSNLYEAYLATSPHGFRLRYTEFFKEIEKLFDQLHLPYKCVKARTPKHLGRGVSPVPCIDLPPLSVLRAALHIDDETGASDRAVEDLDWDTPPHIGTH
jgi:hypothetical protein